MKKSILKTINSWTPKAKATKQNYNSVTTPETPKTIDYKSWWNENNG